MSTSIGNQTTDSRTEELRLALVLNGGVSLAVWMGGVAYELNRLVRETHPVYRGILQLTRTAARIDVISGTSAGGINGAALALAQIHDAGLYSLREIWLQCAGLEQLMRNPDEDNPPSLLRGDSYFLPQIEDALKNLTQGQMASTSSVPMRLTLTTTLMHGIGETHLDDLGAIIEDTTHRARFVFERGDTRDDFAAGKGIVQQLARAARASASFPIAFEPTLYDPQSQPFQSKPLKAQSIKTKSVNNLAYLLDGGILDNKPFDAALDGIGELPADGNTRRVLAYIVPDPKAAVSPPKPDANGKLPPPTVFDVASQSAVGIPGQQSIADQLAAIREHTDQKRKRWQRIVGLLRNTPRDELLRIARVLHPAYRERRLDGAIDYLLTQLEQGLSESESENKPGLRRLTRHWLRAMWLATSGDAIWKHIIPDDFEPEKPIVNNAQVEWKWGLYALEFMANVVIDVLSRTQRLLDQEAPSQTRSADEVSEPGYVPAATGEMPTETDWEEIDARPSAVGQNHRSGSSRIGNLSLQKIWRRAYAIMGRLRGSRERGSDLARAAGRNRFIELLKIWRETPSDVPPQAEAITLLRTLQGGAIKPEEVTQRLQDVRELCELLLELQPHITRILTVPHQSARADVAEALKDLQAYNRYFFEATGNPQPTVDALAWRMLALETIEVGAGTRVHRPNVDAELVQISGRLASPWGGPSAPENKLTGMGLAHFAAFYKRSWRANDWIFGRLDGIDRVLRIALNPDRLQRLYGQRQVQVPGSTQVTSAADYVFECVKALAVDSAPPSMHPQLLTAWERALPDIRKELAWLDCPATVPPPLLEYCAAALTRRLHLEVLLCELPKLAEAIDQDEAIGADASAAAQRLRARIGLQGQSGQLNAATAIDLLKGGLLGEDTLNGEIGSDHFTRIVSQGVAVSHATASTASGKMKALKVLFKLTEWPIQAFYWIANRLSRSSSTNAALEGAMVGIGAALIAAAMLAEKLPSALTAIGWGLLAGGLFASLLRDWRIGLVVLSVSAALIISINPSAAVAAIIFGGALLIVLRFSGALGAVMLIGLAAWWSAGSPTFESAGALVCVDRLRWLALCANHPNAKLLADAERMLEIGVPVLLVVFIVLSTNWSRLARNWWHRRRR